MATCLPEKTYSRLLRDPTFLSFSLNHQTFLFWPLTAMTNMVVELFKLHPTKPISPFSLDLHISLLTSIFWLHMFIFLLKLWTWRTPQFLSFSFFYSSWVSAGISLFIARMWMPISLPALQHFHLSCRLPMVSSPIWVQPLTQNSVAASVFALGTREFSF